MPALQSPPSHQTSQPTDADRVEEAKGWRLTELKPKHKQVCSMLAQGIPRQTIAQVIGCTPEYISMLAHQPLVRDYIREMCQAADLQLDAMFVQSVDTIQEVMANGTHRDKLQAVRLQMEATKRIGSAIAPVAEVVDTNSRLAKLAERLLALKTPTYHEPITVEQRNG